MAIEVIAYVGGGSVSFPKRDLAKEPPFGMWTVVSFAGRVRRAAQWECICKCGTIRIVPQCALLRGDSKSCGCVGAESLSKRRTTHGRYKTPEYTVWCNMLKRCYCAESPNFHNYGGRSITVCERWWKFENFIADMGPRPSHRHSIDRIKNELGYSPENCRWATRKEQNTNRRGNVVLTYKGTSGTVSEWAERTGINYATLWGRIFRSGMSVSDALEMPLKAQYSRVANIYKTDCPD